MKDLYDKLVTSINDGKRPINKQRRNELLCVLSCIADLCPNANFITIDLMNLVYNNLRINTNENHLLDNDDFEFKRILVNLTKSLCNIPNCRTHMVKVYL